MPAHDPDQRFEQRLTATLHRLADAGAPTVDADRVLTRLRRRAIRRNVVWALRLAAMLALAAPLAIVIVNRQPAPTTQPRAAAPPRPPAIDAAPPYMPPTAVARRTTTTTLFAPPDALAAFLRSAGLEGVSPWGDAWADAPAQAMPHADPIARAAVTLDFDWQAAVLAYPEWAGIAAPGEPHDDPLAVF
jgi:hypothetical protein